jgi:hypothetical protein
MRTSTKIALLVPVVVLILAGADGYHRIRKASSDLRNAQDGARRLSRMVDEDGYRDVSALEQTFADYRADLIRYTVKKVAFLAIVSALLALFLNYLFFIRSNRKKENVLTKTVASSSRATCPKCGGALFSRDTVFCPHCSSSIKLPRP